MSRLFALVFLLSIAGVGAFRPSTALTSSRMSTTFRSRTTPAVAATHRADLSAQMMLGDSCTTQELASETLGTFLLVLLGTGTVAAATFAQAQVGIWQIAAAWGGAVAIAAASTGGHLNPAVTLGFLVTGRFPARKAVACRHAALEASRCHRDGHG